MAYNERGLAFSAKGDLIKAIADFNEAVALAPKFSDAYLNRARAYLGLQDFEDARLDLRNGA